MKRQQIAAGNWKMNKNYTEGRKLAKAIADGIGDSENLAILGVPAPFLKAVSGIVKKVANLEVAAQNCHQAEKSVGAKYVILGHSERREYFNESHELLAEKVNAVLGKRLIHLSAEDFGKVVIAYEPIWAIGTGVTASPQQAQDMHKAIRSLLADKYGAEVAEGTSILYGGSVKPANAKEIFGQPDVDGGLVGGASLKADDFLQIIHSF